MSGIPPPSPPPPAPLNLAARTGPFSHIRIIPKPAVEETPEKRMQRTNPFIFKKPSFSEEAEANLSPNSNPYNWQANLANASDGASFAQVRIFKVQIFHLVSDLQSRCIFKECYTAEMSADLDRKR